MKKRLLSIILTAFLVLSMVPYAAFADSSIVCPACGGSVTKQERRLLTAHDDFFKCDKCGKWAWANKLGSLNLFSVGDQQILEAADSSGLLNFSFNNGHLIPAEKAPSGIGRKDLPGYNNYNTGTPAVNPDGTYSGNFAMIYDGYWTPFGTSSSRFSAYYGSSYSNGSFSASGNGDISAYAFYDTTNAVSYVDAQTFYYFEVPVTGFYDITIPSVSISASAKNYNDSSISSLDIGGKISLAVVSDKSSDKYVPISSNNSSSWYCLLSNYISGKYILPYITNTYTKSFYATKGQVIQCIYYASFNMYLSRSSLVWQSISMQTAAPTIVCRSYADSSDNKLTNQTNITINNNTWNGNIYVDNSNNLTYIYPQYTTVNEKNETVTNISNTPIIYNNETKKYYTYDTITNNYYYITYEQPTAPTPSPNPKPTWKPGGGSTRGGGTGRYPADPFTADWTLNYYILNNRRYDAYYALKRTEVDTKNNIPWIDDKHYISTTQIPIANGEYTISVPDGVYWRVWQWDEASKTLTGVNSSNWHGNNFTFLFNTTDEYIFEFCKSDGSEFSSPKDVVLKLKNEKITEYEPGDTIVEEPSPSPSPSPSESPAPAPTPDPGTTPTPTPKPGGGTIIVPGGGSGSGSGNNSGISGGDDEGLFGWLWDLLKDLVKAILKAIFKILSNILVFLIWIVERVGLLLPFLPAPAIAALGAGVVLIFVIRIIRFIRG